MTTRPWGNQPDYAEREVLRDRIRELEARLAEQRWIPVTERLPENSNDVLAGYWLGDMWVVHTAWRNDGEWLRGVRLIDGIEYWRPLPDPPEGQE